MKFVEDVEDRKKWLSGTNLYNVKRFDVLHGQTDTIPNWTNCIYEDECICYICILSNVGANCDVLRISLENYWENAACCSIVAKYSKYKYLVSMVVFNELTLTSTM